MDIPPTEPGHVHACIFAMRVHL